MISSTWINCLDLPIQMISLSSGRYGRRSCHSSKKRFLSEENSFDAVPDGKWNNSNIKAISQWNRFCALLHPCGFQQGPRSRLGSRGLSPGTFWDLLNGSFFQIALKCNKKSLKKIISPLAPAHFLGLRGPWVPMSMKMTSLGLICCYEKDQKILTISDRIIMSMCSDN